MRAKIAPIPERHSYIVRLGKGGTDMKRASARSSLSPRIAGVLVPRREFAFPPWSRPELRWTRAGRRRRGVCRGWGAAGQPGGSSRRLCAHDATVGVFRHRLASGSSQGPERRALAAGPAAGVDLLPQLLQLYQAGGALGRMEEHRNRGGLPLKPWCLDVTVVHERPALSLEGGDIHAGGRIGLVRAAQSWLPGRGCKADDTPSQPAAPVRMRSSIEVRSVNRRRGN
jgi:hypothetical protein